MIYALSQQYVQYVHKKVNDLDKKVTEIENHGSSGSGAGNTLMKLIPLSLFGGKSAQQQPQQAPAIAFNAIDYVVDPNILKQNVKRVM